MNDETILKQAIEKAIKNGFELCRDDWKWSVYAWHGEIGVSIVPDFEKMGGTPTYSEGNLSVNDIIFNQDFAKAFWGTELEIEYPDGWMLGNGYTEYEAWQYHLRQIVLVENRLKYLEQFLEKE